MNKTAILACSIVLMGPVLGLVLAHYTPVPSVERTDTSMDTQNLEVFCMCTGALAPTTIRKVSSLEEGLELSGGMNATCAPHDPTFFKVGEVGRVSGIIEHYWDINKECWRTFEYPRYR